MACSNQQENLLKMKKELLLFFSLLFPFLLRAQNPILPDDETSRHFKNEVVGGVLLHQYGWGAFFRKGNHLTGYKKKIYEIEAVSMTSPKELSITNPAYPSGNSFIYGKLNSLLIVRTGMGIQKVLYSKADRAGVEVKYNYSGGISWGLAKPVYVDIVHTINPYEVDITSERYDPLKHSIDSIYGKSSYGNGLSQIHLYPGLYGKLGVNFEFGRYEDVIKALEIGFVADAFLTPIPLMAYVPNNNLYLSFYISFMYGGRW
jgi:hypothetical protein